jgi:hypothetical protein
MGKPRPSSGRASSWRAISGHRPILRITRRTTSVRHASSWVSARTAPTRRITASSFGKIPTTRDRLLISLLILSSGLFDQIFTQCALGNAVNAMTSALAVSISGPTFGSVLTSWSRTCSHPAETASRSGWAKIVRNSAATMSLCDLGIRASRLRAKWTRHR